MLNRKVLRVIIKFCFWRETPSNLIFEVFPNLKIRELLEMLLKYIKPYIWDFKVALGDALTRYLFIDLQQWETYAYA